MVWWGYGEGRGFDKWRYHYNRSYESIYFKQYMNCWYYDAIASVIHVNEISWVFWVTFDISRTLFKTRCTRIESPPVRISPACKWPTMIIRRPYRFIPSPLCDSCYSFAMATIWLGDIWTYYTGINSFNHIIVNQ